MNIVKFWRALFFTEHLQWLLFYILLLLLHPSNYSVAICGLFNALRDMRINRIICILSNIWLMFNCWKRFVLIVTYKILGDSQNYMPPILAPSSAKRIGPQIAIIAKLQWRKDFIFERQLYVHLPYYRFYLLEDYLENWF